MSEIIVYSAITGGYDDPIEDGRVILYEDDIQIGGYSDNLLAKHPKVFPHLYFPDAEYSIWIDGNVSLKVPAEDLVREFLGDADWAAMRHPFRDCAYAEAGICIAVGRGDPEEIGSQVASYREAGFPEDYGLWENSVLIRRHTKEVKEFSERWWCDILGASERDQISFPYTHWGHPIKVRGIETNIHYGESTYFHKVNFDHNVKA